MPDGMAYLWDAVGMLRHPSTFAEIEAYGRLRGLQWHPWEAEELMILDDIRGSAQ